MTSREKINFEMWVYALKMFSDTSFAFTYDDPTSGEKVELYWPHLFYLKYKKESVYNLITEDYENNCYLVSQIWLFLCYRYDHGIEGLEIEPLVKFAVSKKGGVNVNKPLSCEEQKAKLRELQEYIYEKEPSWEGKKFYYQIILASVA